MKKQQNKPQTYHTLICQENVGHTFLYPEENPKQYMVTVCARRIKAALYTPEEIAVVPSSYGQTYNGDYYLV